MEVFDTKMKQQTDFCFDLEINDSFIQSILSEVDDDAGPSKRRHVCVEDGELKKMMNNNLRARKTNEKARWTVNVYNSWVR